MAKQKFVVELSLDDAKKRTKALRTAVTMTGIQSVTLDGHKLVVIGDGTDVVDLTTQLRKKLGYAKLISVTSDDKKENTDKKPQEVIKTVQPLVCPSQYSYPYPYAYHEGVYDYPKFFNIF